jgi:hypothetical protein
MLETGGTIMNRITLIVAIIGLLFASDIASGQNATPPRDTVITGYLACSKDNANAGLTCPFGLHYLDLREGSTYYLRIESTDSNPWMMLEDLHGNGLATDADDFSTLPGSIVFRAPANATYRLIVSAGLPIHEGDYRITMRELPSVFAVAEELTATDARNNDCHERIYDVPMVAHRRYVIDLGSADFDAYLKLMTMENVIVAYQDECNPVRGARIVFTPVRTEVYRITATTLMPNSTGRFTLNVSECE